MAKMRLSKLSSAEKRELLKRFLRERNEGEEVMLPLSHGQRGLWFLHQFETENVAYNLSFAARLRGRLNVPAFKRSLQKLVDRHGSLRTTFGAADGMPFQQVHPRRQVDFRRVDASPWSWTELRKRVEAQVRAPFDLERGPLMRTFLYERSKNEYILLVAAHHLVGDFWSLVVIVEELGVLYAAESENRQAVLPELTSTYGDFVRWQRELLVGSDGERLESYWRKELAGELSELKLPTDHPRPPVQTYDGAAHAFRLPEELTRRIKSLAREEGATLFMVLLAAYQTLLHRYTGQEDLLVGSPVTGRGRPSFENVVGFFVNMVIFRANLSGDPPFRELLSQVKQRVVGALEHQDYPFARLVERLRPPRGAARAPLLQATFVLQRSQGSQQSNQAVFAITQAGAEIHLAGIKLESLGIDSGATQFDVTLFLEEVDGCLLSSLVYNRDLFEHETIERMASHLMSLLEGIADDPDTRLSRLPLLTAAEREQLQNWNARVDHPAGPCVYRIFESQANQAPDRIAVVAENETLTYGELNCRANRVAHALQLVGVAPDAVVGLQLERSVELVVGILGTLKAGGAYLPLDPKNPAERTSFILKDAGVQAFLTAHTEPASPGSSHPASLNIHEILREAGEEKDLATDVEEENLAYVMYTSGSTGPPKGVMVPHRALRNHMEWMTRTFPLTDRDRVLQRTPFNFDASVWEFFAPLMMGARLILARAPEHEDVRDLASVISEHQVTILQLIPSLLGLLLDEPEFISCSSLRRIFCGGESLTLETIERFHARCYAELYNLYGPTEACIDATCWQVEPKARCVRIGRPIDNVQCYVLDRQLQLLPIGVSGELYIGGDGLAHGYRGRPELTAERFIPSPFDASSGARLYRTGDLARWYADGTLEFLGRLDRQVKVRGFRVELEEVEHKLKGHPRIRQAAAVLHDHNGNKRLVAYAACQDDGTISLREIRAFLLVQLPEYMAPSTLIVLKELPLTSSGKVDYSALPPPCLERKGEPVPPRNAREEALAKIWAEVLGVENVGIHDNFFELGGDSILSLQIVSRARKSGLSITLENLLRFQSLAELAEVIEPTSSALFQAPEHPLLVSLQPLGSHPPLFFVHPVEGAVDGLAPLVGLLGRDQPFYGIQSPELANDELEISSKRVEELAELYLEALRALQKRGPYHVGGWSMGATVAYEMARQLRKEGDQVAFVGLLDQGVIPRAWPSRVTASLPFELLRSLTNWGELQGLSLEEQWDRVFRHPQIAQRIGSHPDPSRARRLLKLVLRNDWALRCYIPPTAPLRVTLFRAADVDEKSSNENVDPTMGWGALAREGVELHDVPGNHFTMLRFPHVRHLARMLTRSLHEARGSLMIASPSLETEKL